MAQSFFAELIRKADQKTWLRRAVATGIAIGVAVGVGLPLFFALDTLARKIYPPKSPPLTVHADAGMTGLSSDPSASPAMSPLAIARPLDNAQVDVTVTPDRRGVFEVAGTLPHLNDDVRLYLLVRPVLPPAQEWWVQPEPIIDKDRWTGVAYIGNEQYPPEAGARYALRAVLAPVGIQNGQSFLTISTLKPSAESRTIIVTIANINTKSGP